MKEMKFELFEPYELKVEFQRMPMPRKSLNVGSAKVEQTLAASINAKKALKFDLIAALLAKQGVSDKEFLDTIKQILAM